MPRTPQQHRKFKEHNSLWTPLKPAAVGKDGNCLLCGVNFKLSGQNTWRSLNTGDWKAKVCGLLESTPDFQKESSRLCKECCRKVESLIKRSKDFEDGKHEIIEVRNL